MASEKPPTKAEFLEALSKKGINNLEELVDALLPSETSGYFYNDDFLNDDFRGWWNVNIGRFDQGLSVKAGRG